jgi:ATP-dependent DNA helicase PIF1
MGKPELAIKPDEKFLKAFDTLESDNRNILVTGKAGTGKSTLLRYFYENSRKEMILLAPTGIAAINIQGSTIHSFFKFPLRLLVRAEKEITKFSRDSETYKILGKVDTIVIDEISMVRADIIDAMDYSLRRNNGDPSKPFGGKQMIFFGDLFQLPPVMKNEGFEYELFNQLYDSPYFFSAYALKRNPPLLLEMTQVYRQNDHEFIELLDKFRFGNTDNSILLSLNKKTGTYEENHDWMVTLCTTNAVAERINMTQMRKLTTKPRDYKGFIEGTFDVRSLPTAEKLTLKEGAQVMFIRNDPEKRWVNGTIGQVFHTGRETVKVRLDNGDEHEVDPVTWEKKVYSYNKEKEEVTAEVTGTFTQLPLKPAWAVTIHKSQGLTLDKVHIDLGWGTFAHGQLYVALSRCRTLQGLSLSRPVRLRDVIVDQRVVGFLSKLNSIEV